MPFPSLAASLSLQSRSPACCIAELLIGAALLCVGGCAAAGETAGQAPDAKTEEGGTYQMGGVSTLDAEQAREDRPVARLSDLLKGRVAGVEVRTGPGGRIIVRIRGTTSINGSNAPLYVVDGKAVKAAPGGALPSVNPYAVESIRVLKGPAASAYGSRGANGVIVVTTKDGD